MEQILKYLHETLPTYDDFLGLLMLLLVVFSVLYVLFRIIFYIGDSHTKEKVAKETKKTKEAKVEEKKVEVVKEQPKEQPKKQEVVIQYIEEPKPVFNTSDNCNSSTQTYIIGGSDGVSTRSYGNNYLYDYYNNGKTFNNIEQKKLDSSVDDSIKEIEKKTDELLEVYQDLPTELKRYILNKLLTSK